jgi:23S rRNA maturation mini-RNase III
MSFSIESQAYVVEEHIKELQLSQKLIKHGDSSIRKEKIQKAENTCYLIKTGLETFLLELNTIDDPEELRRWNAWMNQTRTTYENAKNELFSLKNQIDREDLEAGSLKRIQ